MALMQLKFTDGPQLPIPLLILQFLGDMVCFPSSRQVARTDRFSQPVLQYSKGDDANK